MKRRPNTTTWQQIDSTFHVTHGCRWRTAAANYLGVERSQLRDAFDREDLTGAEIDFVHDRLIEAVAVWQGHLAGLASAAGALRADLQRLQSNRFIEQRRIDDEILCADDADRYRVYMQQFMSELNEEAA